jgi:uncharacterized protein YjbI with pentapeptide repeats/mono/diheme cytochrome c family protein
MVSAGASRRAASADAATAQDTTRDSLLVPDSIYQGWKWFHVYCFRCHGEDAIGGVNPAAPDLRWALSRSGANFPRDSFVNTVLNGRLTKGMPAWKVLLDTLAIQELYLYVKARTDGWLKPGRPHRLTDLQSQSAAPRLAPAQDHLDRVDRDYVVAALARATPQHPADFTDKDLSGLDLSGLDLKRANLTKCRLMRTNFRNAQLFSVTLTDAIATEADFTSANLDVAVAYRVDLRRAVLRDVSAFATILEGADLSDADLSGIRFLGPMTNAKAPRAKFVKANLGVDPGNQSMGLMRVDATAVDFGGADFTGASLRKAVLVRASFAGADLTDADVTYADLAGAILKDVRGKDSIRGLDRALHVDQAIFHD